MQRSALYVLGFAAAVCVVCAVIVSSAAVALKEKQEINSALFRRENVLVAAGLVAPGEEVESEEVARRFNERIEAHVIDLETGEYVPGIDPLTFDQRKATTDPATSERAPRNPAQIQRLPNHALVYEVRDASGNLEMVVLPVEGKGLWSTLYGFLALRSDLQTIQGLTFYEHGETPGLGGEVDNPRWKALWEGRKAFDDSGDVQIAVVKGPAGPPMEDPFEVDGLSGATITSRGVTNLVQFWLGPQGFGPYLDRLREATRAGTRG